MRAEIIILCIKGKLMLLVAFEMHCWAFILGSLPLSGLFFQIDSFFFHYQTLPFDSLTNVLSVISEKLLLVSIVTIMEQNWMLLSKWNTVMQVLGIFCFYQKAFCFDCGLIFIFGLSLETPRYPCSLWPFRIGNDCLLLDEVPCAKCVWAEGGASFVAIALHLCYFTL